MLIIRIGRKSITGDVTDGVSRRVPIPDGVYPDVSQVFVGQGLANRPVIFIQVLSSEVTILAIYGSMFIASAYLLEEALPFVLDWARAGVNIHLRRLGSAGSNFIKVIEHNNKRIYVQVYVTAPRKHSLMKRSTSPRTFWANLWPFTKSSQLLA